MLLIEYAKCSTCAKARNFLDSHGVNYKVREVKEEPPTVDELTEWVNKFNIPVNKLFNTSGLKYRELNLKDKLPSMSNEEKMRLLASDGMLIKRPILLSENFILIGFRENVWLDKIN